MLDEWNSVVQDISLARMWKPCRAHPAAGSERGMSCVSSKGTTRLRPRNTLDSFDVQDGVGRAKE